jgi:hypothetical protein
MELPQSEEPPEADAHISLAGGLTLQIDGTSVEVTTSAALEVIPPARFGSPVGVRLGRSETVNLGHKRRREFVKVLPLFQTASDILAGQQKTTRQQPRRKKLQRRAERTHQSGHA